MKTQYTGFHNAGGSQAMPDVQAMTFARAVIMRPAMYTMNGTFAEVVSFMTGYCSGVAKGHPDAPPVVDWVEFEQWLARLNGVDSSDALRRVYESHRDDCDRLKALAELYDRFSADR